MFAVWHDAGRSTAIQAPQPKRLEARSHKSQRPKWQNTYRLSFLSLAERHSTLQHYAVKTLENLYTKKDLWADILARASTAGKNGTLRPQSKLASATIPLLNDPSQPGSMAAGVSLQESGLPLASLGHELILRGWSCSADSTTAVHGCISILCANAVALLELWTSALLEPLRICAASALCRMLTIYPDLIKSVTSRTLMEQVVSRTRPVMNFLRALSWQPCRTCSSRQ